MENNLNMNYMETKNKQKCRRYGRLLSDDEDLM